MHARYRFGTRALGVSIALLATLAGPPPALAQPYPTRPIKVVVPFSPGGAVDGPMRVIAQELFRDIGGQVVIENKPGAGATIGADFVAKSPGDGYTLLLASQTTAISATLYPKLPFDPVADFVPITLIGREPGVVVVNPALPVATLQELVAYAREHPGDLDYASSGNGSGQHLFAALLASMTGVKLNHVPYRGSAQATADLLGGQVMMSIPGTAGMVGHIARAIVFGLIGVFLVKAAIDYKANEAIGLDGALAKLYGQPYGPWLLGAVAAGLVVFGIFSITEARYRRI